MDNWTPQYESQQIGKVLRQNQLDSLQMVQFECPKYRNLLLAFTFDFLSVLFFRAAFGAASRPFSPRPIVSFGNERVRENFIVLAYNGIPKFDFIYEAITPRTTRIG